MSVSAGNSGEMKCACSNIDCFFLFCPPIELASEGVDLSKTGKAVICVECGLGWPSLMRTQPISGLCLPSPLSSRPQCGL